MSQVDTAALACVSSKTIGRMERGEIELGALRVFVLLLEFREEQIKKGRR